VQKPWSRISQAWAPLINRAAAKFPIDILFYKKGFYTVTVFPVLWIRIRTVWISIEFGRLDTDPDPAGQK
jgi:hypothetical protein